MINFLLQWLGIPTGAEVQALREETRLETESLWAGYQTMNGRLIAATKRIEALEEQQPQRHPGPPWRLICDAPGCGAVQTPGVDGLAEGWVRHDVGAGLVLCGKCKGMPRDQVRAIEFAKRAGR